MRQVVWALLAMSSFTCCRSAAPAGDPHQALLAAGIGSFIDKGDKGDDPWAPGCHYSYTDRQCKTNQKFDMGDSCIDATHLLEWWDTNCHTLSDSKKYDCDAECKKKSGGRGKCVKDEDACGVGNHSAHCECLNLTGLQACPHPGDSPGLPCRGESVNGYGVFGASNQAGSGCPFDAPHHPCEALDRWA